MSNLQSRKTEKVRGKEENNSPFRMKSIQNVNDFQQSQFEIEFEIRIEANRFSESGRTARSGDETHANRAALAVHLPACRSLYQPPPRG